MLGFRNTQKKVRKYTLSKCFQVFHLNVFIGKQLILSRKTLPAWWFCDNNFFLCFLSFTSVSVFRFLKFEKKVYNVVSNDECKLFNSNIEGQFCFDNCIKIRNCSIFSKKCKKINKINIFISN